jgi:hypothetical protein
MFFLAQSVYLSILTIRCWSNGIGRNGNQKQTINLDPGCWGVGTVVHEIGQLIYKCNIMYRGKN